MEDYKSNSHKSREHNKNDSKKIQKVVSGEIKKRKKSEVRKFADIFLPEDVENVKNHVIYDVIIPSIKKVILDTVDTWLYGENGSSKKSSTSKFSYERCYDDHSGTGNKLKSASPRTSYAYDEVVLNNRGDAEAVLDQLAEIIERYDFVTVADLNESLGITGRYTDNNWGWYSVANARVDRVRGGGYMLRLPKPVAIDD